MTISTMRQIATAAEADGLEVTAYEGYSGRGMYGDKTAAVVATSLGAFIGALASALLASDDPDEMAGDLAAVRTDSMGRDVVIY